MKISDNAYLLKKIKFGDSSLILDFYTETNGRVSVIAKGHRKKSKIALIPFSVFEITYTQPKGSSSLGNLYQISESDSLRNSVGNVLVGGISMFCSEFLLVNTESSSKDDKLYTLFTWVKQRLEKEEDLAFLPIDFVLNWGFVYGIEWLELENEYQQNHFSSQKSLFQNESWKDNLNTKIKRAEVLQYLLEMLYRSNISNKESYNSIEVLKSVW